MRDGNFVASALEIEKRVRFLCGLGSRVAGSEENKEASRYCERHFKKLGLDVKTEDWDLTVFKGEDARLRVLEPELCDLTCRALTRSCPTPKGGVTAELVFLDSSMEQDYKGKDVAGKIVLVRHPQLGSPHAVGLVDIAKEHGAAGLIKMSCTVGTVITPMAVHRYGSPIPCCAISLDDGLYLIGLLDRKKVKVWLKLNSSLEKGVAYNVTATLKGRERPSEFIFIIDHTDTVDGCPGASDNASGVATVLEVAELLSKKVSKRSIAFVTLSGEEGGCPGANVYVEKHKDEIRNIKALVDIDSVGEPGRITIFGKAMCYPYGLMPGTHVRSPDWLLNFIQNVGRELGYKVSIAEGEQAFCGDNGPFALHGVPSTYLGVEGGAYSYYHNWRDNLENCEINKIKIVADIVANAAWKLANSERIPPEP